MDGTELADGAVHRQGQGHGILDQRTDPRLELAGEEGVEARVVGRIFVQSLAHVDAVLLDKGLDHPGGEVASLGGGKLADQAGEGVFGQAVLTGNFQVVSDAHDLHLLFLKRGRLIGSQPGLLPTVAGFLHGFQDAVIVVEAVRADGATADRRPQGAAGIILVGAVAEFATAEVVAKLHETPGDAIGFQMPEGELADPGGVDEIAAAREVIEPRRGGGMGAQPRVFGDLAGEHAEPRHQGVGE